MHIYILSIHTLELRFQTSSRVQNQGCVRKAETLLERACGWSSQQGAGPTLHQEWGCSEDQVWRERNSEAWCPWETAENTCCTRLETLMFPVTCLHRSVYSVLLNRAASADTFPVESWTLRNTRRVHEWTCAPMRNWHMNGISIFISHAVWPLQLNFSACNAHTKKTHLQHACDV